MVTTQDTWFSILRRCTGYCETASTSLQMPLNPLCLSPAPDCSSDHVSIPLIVSDTQIPRLIVLFSGITKVTPSSGSMAGGTAITIRGDNFDNTDHSLIVEIAGKSLLQCHITSPVSEHWVNSRPSRAISVLKTWNGFFTPQCYCISWVVILMKIQR